MVERLEGVESHCEVPLLPSFYGKVLNPRQMGTAEFSLGAMSVRLCSLLVLEKYSKDIGRVARAR